MGRNRRRRAAGNDRSHDVIDTRSGDDIIVLLESKSTQSSDKAVKAVSPPVWTIDFFDNITEEAPSCIVSSDAIHTVMEVGLQIARGTLDRLSNRLLRKIKKGTACPSVLSNIHHVKPTPIQLRIWPALLFSFQARNCSEASGPLNVVGIAPTGTGANI